MALLHRPLVTQLACDVIAYWLRRSTGLEVVQGDRNQPRSGLPYVGYTFPRGRTLTGDARRLHLTETLGSTDIIITAAEGERAAVILGPRLVDVSREVGESADDFATRWAVEASWWTRGRSVVTAVGSVVTVAPIAPGLLPRAEAVEGCTLVSAVGAATQRVDRLYRPACRVTVYGAPVGGAVGEAGDGLDVYSIEAAIREGLSDPVTRAILRGGWLVPVGTPADPPSYASAVSGAQREARVTFDLAFGWTGLYSTATEIIETIEVATTLAGEGLPLTDNELLELPP